MNNQTITKSEKKISQLKLEIIKFSSADVIATSAILPVMLTADPYEFIANFTFTDNNIVQNTISTDYYEPTNVQ